VIGVPDALEVADSVPQADPVHPLPASAHVTPLFWLSLVTVAVKLCVASTATEAIAGETLRDIVDVEPPLPLDEDVEAEQPLRASKARGMANE
jgi:hypothetical protein